MFSFILPYLAKLTRTQKRNFFFLSGINLFFFLLMVLAAGAPVFTCLALLVIFQGLLVGYYFFFLNNAKPKTVFREWTDAILFAVVAATLIRTFFLEAFTIPTSSMEKSLLIGDFLFVSKVNYGARVPMTPLSFPFAHHTMPMTKDVKSYLNILNLPYFRLPGFTKIKNNDIVVFNYPMEDFRPIDKKENYIKRCIGIPGDTIQINNMKVFVNGKEAQAPEKSQFSHLVVTDGSAISGTSYKELGYPEGGPAYSPGQFVYLLTREAKNKLQTFPFVKSVEVLSRPRDLAEPGLFPGDSLHPWNVDNYGPIIIPKEGMKIQLNHETVAVYKRAIVVYEGRDLVEKEGKYFLDGKEAIEYTFTMNYYWMMGDNRHNSADSRFWGFVPENHIVGKAVFIWFSWEANGKKLLEKIRFSRLFRFIHSD